MVSLKGNENFQNIFHEFFKFLQESVLLINDLFRYKKIMAVVALSMC